MTHNKKIIIEPDFELNSVSVSIPTTRKYLPNRKNLYAIFSISFEEYAILEGITKKKVLRITTEELERFAVITGKEYLTK